MKERNIFNIRVGKSDSLYANHPKTTVNQDQEGVSLNELASGNQN
jgi:hypothetical protein